VIALDDNGEAVVDLPDWFDDLDMDFRYQLTAVGAPVPNLHIAEEIVSDTTNASQQADDYSNNTRFRIAGGNPGMKVSWQVTGIRQDPWANANRVKVEEDKSENERGHYLYPQIYGQPAEMGISHTLFLKWKCKSG
jgi:hypothetical protein